MNTKNPYQYSDEDLVKGALNRDRLLQEMLYRKYADAMYNIAYRYAKDPDEAADILQEGFIKVFDKLSQHDTSKSLAAWIKRIIINTAITKIQKKALEREKIQSYASEQTDDVEEENDQLVKAKEIKKRIEQLPGKAQLVLKLYILEGLAHKEIADLLNISVGTSKSQLNYAKKLLKQTES